MSSRARWPSRSRSAPRLCRESGRRATRSCRSPWAIRSHRPFLEVIQASARWPHRGKPGNELAQLAAATRSDGRWRRDAFLGRRQRSPARSGIRCPPAVQIDLLAVLHGLGELDRKCSESMPMRIGYFFAVRLASQFGFEAAGCVVELLLAGAEVSRGPVELAQAVENGAGNADAGVLPEGEIPARPKRLAASISPMRAGLDQVVELHRSGQAAQDGARDLLDLVQMAEDQLLLLVFSQAGNVWRRRKRKRSRIGRKMSASHRPAFSPP